MCFLHSMLIKLLMLCYNPLIDYRQVIDMELWDLYNNGRELTGKTIERGKTIPNGMRHLVVHVCIFNSKREMLVQQRQPFKDGWPDLWDLTVGGSAVAGDNSKTTAYKEVLEEIGYDLSYIDLTPSFSVTLEHAFDDIYIVEKDIEISELSLQKSEVKNIKWADISEIFSMIDNGTFIPYYKSFIELLFDQKIKSGLRFKKDETDLSKTKDD